MCFGRMTALIVKGDDTTTGERNRDLRVASAPLHITCDLRRVFAA